MESTSFLSMVGVVFFSVTVPQLSAPSKVVGVMIGMELVPLVSSVVVTSLRNHRPCLSSLFSPVFSALSPVLSAAGAPTLASSLDSDLANTRSVELSPPHGLVSSLSALPDLSSLNTFSTKYPIGLATAGSSL